MQMLCVDAATGRALSKLSSEQGDGFCIITDEFYRFEDICE
jgi:hypothetical protein